MPSTRGTGDGDAGCARAYRGLRGARARTAQSTASISSLAPRERLAIVGESGSGKSQLLLACIGLLAANGRAAGSVRFDGNELLGAADAAARVRGTGIGFVFQDAGGSLTPHRRIGDQMVEVALARPGTSKRDAADAALDMLERVRLPDPAATLARYPHELSGGMRQRVAIALALVARPRLLFADEPTTALDVTVQAEVMALLAELCEGLGMGLVVVTHDLGVVAALADRIAVMYAGRIVEEGAASALLSRPGPSLHRGPAGGSALAFRRDGRRAAHDRRPAACARHGVFRLPIRAALPACRGSVPSDRSAARSARCGSCRLPFSSGLGACPMNGGLTVRDVVVTYPRGEAGRTPLTAVAGVSLTLASGRDTRPRRRIRLRQVHPGPCDPRPRPARGRGDLLAGTAHRRVVAPCLSRDSGRTSARVPGPERVPRSAHDDCRERCRTASLAGTRPVAGRA